MDDTAVVPGSACGLSHTVWTEVATNLSSADIAALTGTCREVHTAIDNNATWELLLHRDAGPEALEQDGGWLLQVLRHDDAVGGDRLRAEWARLLADAKDDETAIPLDQMPPGFVKATYRALRLRQFPVLAFAEDCLAPAWLPLELDLRRQIGLLSRKDQTKPGWLVGAMTTNDSRHAAMPMMPPVSRRPRPSVVRNQKYRDEVTRQLRSLCLAFLVPAADTADGAAASDLPPGERSPSLQCWARATFTKRRVWEPRTVAGSRAASPAASPPDSPRAFGGGGRRRSTRTLRRLSAAVEARVPYAFVPSRGEVRRLLELVSPVVVAKMSYIDATRELVAWVVAVGGSLYSGQVIFSTAIDNYVREFPVQRWLRRNFAVYRWLENKTMPLSNYMRQNSFESEAEGKSIKESMANLGWFGSMRFMLTKFLKDAKQVFGPSPMQCVADASLARGTALVVGLNVAVAALKTPEDRWADSFLLPALIRVFNRSILASVAFSLAPAVTIRLMTRLVAWYGDASRPAFRWCAIVAFSSFMMSYMNRLRKRRAAAAIPGGVGRHKNRPPSTTTPKIGMLVSATAYCAARWWAPVRPAAHVMCWLVRFVAPDVADRVDPCSFHPEDADGKSSHMASQLIRAGIVASFRVLMLYTMKQTPGYITANAASQLPGLTPEAARAIVRSSDVSGEKEAAAAKTAKAAPLYRLTWLLGGSRGKLTAAAVFAEEVLLTAIDSAATIRNENNFFAGVGVRVGVTFTAVIAQWAACACMGRPSLPDRVARVL